jgi:hypothetical protein
MNNIALRQSVVAGVIGGLIFAGFSFGTYYSGIQSFAGFSIIYTWIPVIFVLILILGFNVRKKLGGYMSFKEVLQYALVAYLVYEIISAIVTYVLFVAIDPALTQKLLDAVMQKTVGWMRRFGTPEAKIDEALANAKLQKVDTGVGTIVKGIAWSLIWDFVKSLIIAWIVKKDRPADLDFNPKPLA